MKINLSPQRRDDQLTITKYGDCLTINGIDYDFTALPEGATLPREAIDCQWIISDITRINGEIEMTIILPCAANASNDARFPNPIINPQDGILELPQ